MTGQVINQGRILINPFRTFGFFSISGDVVHDGTEIRVEDSSTLAFFGKVSGGGEFTGTGVAAFEGGYSPGNSPDGVSFAGDVEFGAGNTLGMELGGLLRGTEYDALDIAGTATLGGLLDVALWNDFTPEAGDAFDLIVARAISGQFSASIGDAQVIGKILAQLEQTEQARGSPADLATAHRARGPPGQGGLDLG